MRYKLPKKLYLLLLLNWNEVSEDALQAAKKTVPVTAVALGWDTEDALQAAKKTVPVTAVALGWDTEDVLQAAAMRVGQLRSMLVTFFSCW